MTDDETKALIELFKKADGIILLVDGRKIGLGQDIIDEIRSALELSLNPPGWGIAL